jgi:hypothetical protein
MDYPEFETVDEATLEYANNCLQNGWKFIRCFIVKKKVGTDKDGDIFSEVAYYAIGKPKGK